MIFLMLYLLYQAYYFIIPRVVVNNLSLENVRFVTVMLPNGRLEFSSLNKGSVQIIYYSINQSDGSYNYVVEYADGEKVIGHCGYVTSHQFGKTLLLTLRPERVITCS
jgi:hypothetical protein